MITLLVKTKRLLPRACRNFSMSDKFVYPVIDSDRKHFDFSQFHSNSNSDYAQALNEIKSGRKTSHWIWYIFPQLGLHGNSGMSKHFGLKSLEEAEAYLQDPVLGQRLVEISEAALEWLRPKSTPINRLMGSSIDASKLLSCATLFSYASRGMECNGMFTELKLICEEALGTSDLDSQDFCERSMPTSG